MENNNRYNFKVIENKWQKFWEKNKSFKTKINKEKEKFYCLEIDLFEEWQKRNIMIPGWVIVPVSWMCVVELIPRNTSLEKTER